MRMSALITNHPFFHNTYPTQGHLESIPGYIKPIHMIPCLEKLLEEDVTGENIQTPNPGSAWHTC